MKEEKKIRKFNKKLCAASFFIALIAYVITSYYTKCWTWTLFIFTLVPLLPIITGIKKISFEFFILMVYLIIGFGFKAWHPYWVIFALIPIYHIFFDELIWKKKVKTRANKKNDDNIIDIDK